MMLKKPPPLPHWQSILYPFLGVVWAVVGVVVIVTTLAFYFVNFQGLHLSVVESFLIILQVNKINFAVGLLFLILVITQYHYSYLCCDQHTSASVKAKTYSSIFLHTCQPTKPDVTYLHSP